jgi:DNA-binding CsgD family transcriptional regulator
LVLRMDLTRLTPREREIVGLIQAYKTNKEIADQLRVSVHTVKNHMHNIFVKTSATGRRDFLLTMSHHDQDIAQLKMEIAELKRLILSSRQ